MSVTRLTDVIPVKQFSAVIEAQLTENCKFRQSGVVGTDPRIEAKAQAAGLECVLREWKRVAQGEANSANDDPANKIVPQNVAQQGMTARILSRVLSFSAMEITDFISDADAIDFAVSELVRLRLADQESTLIASLNGILLDAAANHVVAGSSDMLTDVSITTGTIAAANLLDKNKLILGRGKMGDKGENLKTLVMHSDVANNLRLNEPNAFIPTSKTDIGLSSYLGWNVVETDQIGKGGTASYPIYTTYMCGDGLFAYAAAPVSEVSALAEFRDEFAGGGSGQTTIFNRFRYLLHPYGYSNSVVPTNGVSQANAELAAAATWTRVAQRKAIPLVGIKTNG